MAQASRVFDSFTRYETVPTAGSLAWPASGMTLES
jgi:hypothetical protein